MRNVLGIICIAVCSCTPSTVTPPPDSSDAAPILGDGAQTPCSAACSVLASLGCPSGMQPDCVSVLAHCDGSRQCAQTVGPHVGQAIACAPIAAATSKAGVVAAGVACP
jgi:hypothetical protein